MKTLLESSQSGAEASAGFSSQRNSKWSKRGPISGSNCGLSMDQETSPELVTLIWPGCGEFGAGVGVGDGVAVAVGATVGVGVGVGVDVGVGVGVGTKGPAAGELRQPLQPWELPARTPTI